MPNNDNKNTTIACLQHALADSQATIRAYDSKAEILAVLLTVALGITNFTALQQSAVCFKALLAAGWIIGLVAIGFLGEVG